LQLKKEDRFYLQLPIKEGKKDRIDLERWLPVGLAFIGLFLSKKKQTQQKENNSKGLLIHCAQGMDRSVALTMAAIVLFCQEGEEKDSRGHHDDGLIVAPWCYQMTLESLDDAIRSNEFSNTCGENSISSATNRLSDTRDNAMSEGINNNSNDNISYESTPHKLSGMTQYQVNSLLQHPRGKHILFSWIAKCQGLECTEELFAANVVTKESLKRTIQRVRQYHLRADPSRSTMQKLNRFFLSASYEK